LGSVDRGPSISDETPAAHSFPEFAEFPGLRQPAVVRCQYRHPVGSDWQEIGSMAKGSDHYAED
jgi:hypothetical protein